MTGAFERRGESAGPERPRSRRRNIDISTHSLGMEAHTQTRSGFKHNLSHTYARTHALTHFYVHSQATTGAQAGFKQALLSMQEVRRNPEPANIDRHARHPPCEGLPSHVIQPGEGEGEREPFHSGWDRWQLRDLGSFSSPSGGKRASSYSRTPRGLTSVCGTSNPRGNAVVLSISKRVIPGWGRGTATSLHGLRSHTAILSGPLPRHRPNTAHIYTLLAHLSLEFSHMLSHTGGWQH